MGGMTDLLTRPVRAVLPGPDRPARSLVVSGVIGGLVVAGSGVLVAVALAVCGWFSADAGSFGAAVRVGLVGWLVANGAGLVVPGAVVAAVPLGAVVVVAIGLYVAGRWAARQGSAETWGDVGLATAGVCLGYVVAAVVVHLATRGGSGHAIGWRVVAVPLLVAGLASAAGALRTTDLLPDLLARLPDGPRAALEGAAAVVCTLLAVSALVLSVALVLSFGTAVDLAEGLGAGTFGDLVVALVGVAFVPNAVLLTGSYVAGPGFAVGTGTVVAPTDVGLGPVPGHPLLAALPSGSGSWWQVALIGVPVVAGAVGGLIAARRCPTAGWDRLALWGGTAGLGGGFVFGLSTWLAGGAIGPGRMADVGSDLLAVVPAVAVGCLVGGLAGALAWRWLGAAAGAAAGAADGPADKTAHETAHEPTDESLSDESLS